jgi:hypothetical protein
MTSCAARYAVLLLTHCVDFYTVGPVGEALKRRGAPFRLNTDRLTATINIEVKTPGEWGLLGRD